MTKRSNRKNRPIKPRKCKYKNCAYNHRSDLAYHVMRIGYILLAVFVLGEMKNVETGFFAGITMFLVPYIMDNVKYILDANSNGLRALNLIKLAILCYFSTIGILGLLGIASMDMANMNIVVFSNHLIKPYIVGVTTIYLRILYVSIAATLIDFCNISFPVSEKRRVTVSA